MDVLTMNELEALSERGAGSYVSIFMPTHRAGEDTRQDPIRYANLLRQAEEQLIASGLRSPVAREVLKPAQALLDDPGFWRRLSDGLALFAAPHFFRTYRLPLDMNESVVVADRFHIKPLLPFFVGDGHFFILGLSQSQIRLLEGTRHTVDEVGLENMPESMAEALQYEQFDRQMQFHTGTPSAKGTRAAVFHGHDPSDEDKGRILRWFHKVDDELRALLAGEQSPLVLAGVDYLFPLYSEANSYPHLVEEGVSGNPEDLRPKELHARAWALVEPIFRTALETAAARYRQLAGTGQTTADVREAVLAALHGRVDTLFVAADVQVWGRLDGDAQTVTERHNPEPGDEDLLDLAAVETMLKGGTVFAVERDAVPGSTLVAALLRY